MATDQFTVVIEPDGDEFHAYVPSLSGCHTFGATVEEARANLLEAVAQHGESLAADGEFPPPAAGHGTRPLSPARRRWQGRRWICAVTKHDH